MLGTSRHGRRPMRLLAATLPVVAALLVLPGVASAKPAACKTIPACRTAAAWNHGIITRDLERLSVARGQAGGARALPACHTLGSCRGLATSQAKSRVWAEGAWRYTLTANTPATARLVIRYEFAPCGAEAQRRALLIVGWESSYYRYSRNGAGDTGWWQFELPAHPDITAAQAEDIEWSTLRARRDSRCGTDWSPEWSSVRDHGEPWD